MIVEIRSSSKGQQITTIQSARSVDLTVPKQYGYREVHLTANGNAIPMTLLTDLSLMGERSSAVQSTVPKQQYETWEIINDITLQEDINWYRDGTNKPPVEWLWHDR